jgi:uncharacterized Zn finger protein (UPF0148 family)
VRENEKLRFKTPTSVLATMTGDARAVCPTCGAPLFTRDHGDQTCVSHGHFVPRQVLDATFGAGASQRIVTQTKHAPMTPRKCPDDRYEMSALASATGSIVADACGRCGGLWVPLSSIEVARSQAPLQREVSQSEARSLYALACARSIVPTVTTVRR